MEQQQKIALVGGASRGIGRATARMLARQGFLLVLPYIEDWPEDARTLGEEFRGEDRHLVRACDLRDTQQVHSLARDISRLYGRLHVLVNNIERGGMPVVHGSYDLTVNQGQWELEIATTLGAKKNVFNAVLPLLKKSGKAAVVNINSIAARTGRSGPVAPLFSDGYAAACRAVSSLTETWARMAAPEVRVNELLLGLVETRHAEGSRGWGLLGEEERKRILAHSLLGRTGKIEDVLAALRFLLEDADFVTGATLRLDGGYLLGGETVPPLPPGVLDLPLSPP